MKATFYDRAADRTRYFAVFRSKDNHTPAHFHNATEIIVVTAGAERVVINGAEQILHPGDVGVCNSLDVHYYEYIDHSEVTVVMLGEEYTARYRESDGGRLPNFFLGEERFHELIAVIDALETEKLRGGDNLIIMGYVDVLLGTLRALAPENPRRNTEMPRAAEILLYIDEHFADGLSLDEVARHFGYSKNYFSTFFNRFAGMHFRDYLNRLRVSRAATMRGSGKKASEIMADCGFGSPNSYYRAIKKWDKSQKS